MGPLVPFIISNEFNLIIALLAGIGFGFVLEQAGFSSTRKLVGLFYGYDFTVLKVFFTAGVTAMIGILFLNHLGLLDISLIYINPTYLWSALIGGAIMGVGFIIGGFCPGTSVCAAAIGKLDGMAFVFGGALGVLIFAEGYPLFEKIYLAEAWGPLLVNEQLGMSKILFAVILTTVAISAFYFTSLIENRVNGLVQKQPKERLLKYSSAISLAVIILLCVAFIPDSNERLKNRISKELKTTEFSRMEIPADKLATEIVNNYHKINIIDTRDARLFNVYHLPLAINIPLDQMQNREWQKFLDQKHKVNYFYADDHQTARRAFLLASHIGDAENFMLKESTAEFKTLFSDSIPPGLDSSKQEINTYNFRRKAANDMNILVNIFKNLSQPVATKTSKIKGGC